MQTASIYSHYQGNNLVLPLLLFHIMIYRFVWLGKMRGLSSSLKFKVRDLTVFHSGFSETQTFKHCCYSVELHQTRGYWLKNTNHKFTLFNLCITFWCV